MTSPADGQSTGSTPGGPTPEDPTGGDRSASGVGGEPVGTTDPGGAAGPAADGPVDEPDVVDLLVPAEGVPPLVEDTEIGRAHV